MRTLTVFNSSVFEANPVKYENTEEIERNLFRQTLHCEHDAISLLLDSVGKKELTSDEILLVAATRALQLKLILGHYQTILNFEDEALEASLQEIENSYEALRAEVGNNSEAENMNHFTALVRTVAQALRVISCFQENEPEKQCENNSLLNYLRHFRNCLYCLSLRSFRKISTENRARPKYSR